jgi:hypothetical protein
VFDWNFSGDNNLTDAEVYGIKKSLSHRLATIHFPLAVAIVFDGYCVFWVGFYDDVDVWCWRPDICLLNGTVFYIEKEVSMKFNALLDLSSNEFH